MNLEARLHGLITTAELAARPDFAVGEAVVSPSTRTVRGPGGEALVEPRVMQVLVVLAEAAGTVVTRETLFDRCWGSRQVGDDSLNRAVAGVRRIASGVAGGSFEVETVPRTGYRLATRNTIQSTPSDRQETASPGPLLTRRAAAAGALATAAVVAGGAGIWAVQGSRDRQFADLMTAGQQALDFGDPSANPVQYFRRAAALRPDHPRAQGLFAYTSVMRVETGDGREAGVDVTDAERATRTALALDSAEPYARLASIVLERSRLDFAATEDRVRDVLANAPNNTSAMRQLWSVMQCVGRSREALALVERAIAVAPLSAANNFPRAQLLWILGRTAEADRVIDTAVQYWPTHRFVRFAKFTILAFTGRARAALAMLESKETAPQHYSPAAIALWRVSLPALDQGSPAAVGAARTANLEAARSDLRLASQAVLTLSALGEVDAAFEVANALLVFRPPAGMGRAAADRRPAKGTAWRFAPWLFTPPTAALRADLRFEAVCDEIGLTDYWMKRGIKPDYQLNLA